MQKLLFQSGLSGLQKTFRPIQVYLYLDTIQYKIQILYLYYKKYLKVSYLDTSIKVSVPRYFFKVICI